MFRFNSLTLRSIFWLLIAVTLAGRLAVACADHRSLIALDIYQDDAFYYLQIADNLAEGRGLTFDGSVATNGVQPLYLLLLVPVMRWTQGDLVAPIHISGVILSLVALGSGFLLFALVRVMSSARVGLLALALWAISPYFIAHGVNGLETGLAVFFLLAVLSAYLHWCRAPGELTLRRALLFGVICGLAVLARLDLALLLLAIGVDWTVTTIRNRSFGQLLPRICLAGLIALITWLPWGIFSYSQSGSWLPQSGAAGREIALNYGWLNLRPIWTTIEGPARYFTSDAVPAAYYADVATKQALVFLHEHPLLVALRAKLPFEIWPALHSYSLHRWFVQSPQIGATLLVLLLAGSVLALSRFGARERVSAAAAAKGSGLILAIFFGLSYLGYTFYAPVHWYYPRYLILPIVFSMVYMLVKGHTLLAVLWRQQIAARLTIGAVLVSICACQLYNYWPGGDEKLSSKLSWSETQPGGFLKNWQDLESKIDRTKKIGAFQAGIYGYFSGLDVVNLDGKVNPEAHEALRNRRLDHYIAEQEIDYILDWQWITHALCLRHIQRPAPIRLQTLERGEGPYDVSLYRVIRH